MRFVGWEPQANTDPKGRTSRSDISGGTLFYTWNLGWIDFNHANNPRVGIGEAWDLLKSARSGEVLKFSLQMDQGKGFSYKQSRAEFQIIAEATEEARKAQLLYAFEVISNQFESYQGVGIQGSQLATTLYGWSRIRHGLEEFDWDKRASSYSTEDMVSNLMLFLAETEEVKPLDVVRLYGGYIEDQRDRKELSSLVWDFLLSVEMNGSKDRGFEPVQLDRRSLFGQKLLAKLMGDVLTLLRLERLEELLEKYDAQFGPPVRPQMPVASSKGVSVVSSKNTDQQ